MDVHKGMYENRPIHGPLSSEKQGVEFRLRSPDEAEARTAFEASHPALVKERQAVLQSLTPPQEHFEEDQPEDEASDQDDADDSEEVS